MDQVGCVGRSYSEVLHKCSALALSPFGMPATKVSSSIQPLVHKIVTFSGLPFQVSITAANTGETIKGFALKYNPSEIRITNVKGDGKTPKGDVSGIMVLKWHLCECVCDRFVSGNLRIMKRSCK